MDGMGTQQLAEERSGPRQPSPGVYRRRRLVAGVIALLLLVGLGFAVAGVVGALTPEKQAGPATVPAPTLSAPPATPAAPEPTASETPKPAETTAATACPNDSVSVAAVTDAPVYPAGASPVLTLTVTNTGESACEINVGTSQMEFSVASGSDRIFSSLDCQDGGEDFLKKVEPGASETANFTWERNRSAPGCAAVASNPNPGTYSFTARLGETTSEAAVFQLE